MIKQSKINGLNALSAISAIDGRYHKKTSGLSNYFSEQALICARVWIECEWLRTLAEYNITGLPARPKNFSELLDKIIEKSLTSASEIKKIEQTTNHDVKAVEYWLQLRFKKTSKLKPWIPFIHFACTSEDINNLAYARLLQQYINSKFLPDLQQNLNNWTKLVRETKSMPMLARTHGQPASPTTLGKELCNICDRIKNAIIRVEHAPIRGKFNGAVGNFNAHRIAFPDYDWQSLSYSMIKNCELDANFYTTQIENHDDLAFLLFCVNNLNNILIDACRDVWSYISQENFSQQNISGEIGSSTMPHKINPIDFENAEGNLGLSNAMASHLANKLPISRLQRDLSDSTVMRNLGSVFAYNSIALQSINKGLAKLQPNPDKMLSDLNSHWEVLAEAIQSCLRAEGQEDAYEAMKDLTRGKQITEQLIKNSIDKLQLSNDTKQRLLELTPATYTGDAVALTDKWLKENATK